MATTQVQVKASFGEDIRRFVLNSATFASLEQAVRTAFQLDACVIKYIDDENDQVTMASDEDMATAFELSKERPLRVVVRLNRAPTDCNAFALRPSHFGGEEGRPRDVSREEDEEDEEDEDHDDSEEDNEDQEAPPETGHCRGAARAAGEHTLVSPPPEATIDVPFRLRNGEQAMLPVNQKTLAILDLAGLQVEQLEERLGKWKLAHLVESGLVLPEDALRVSLQHGARPPRTCRQFAKHGAAHHHHRATQAHAHPHPHCHASPAHNVWAAGECMRGRGGRGGRGGWSGRGRGRGDAFHFGLSHSHPYHMGGCDQRHSHHSSMEYSSHRPHHHRGQSGSDFFPAGPPHLQWEYHHHPHHGDGTPAHRGRGGGRGRFHHHHHEHRFGQPCHPATAAVAHEMSAMDITGGASEPESQAHQGGRHHRPRAARFVRHITIPDCTLVQPGTSLLKKWCVRNDSRKPWPAHCELVAFGGNMRAFGAVHQQVFDAPGSIAPGEEAEVSAPVTIGTRPGQHVAFWKLREVGGLPFGQRLFVRAVVAGDQQSAPGEEGFSAPEASPSQTVEHGFVALADPAK